MQCALFGSMVALPLWWRCPYGGVGRDNEHPEYCNTDLAGEMTK